MKYWGEFRSLSNELYKVEFQKGSSTPSYEITLGPNAFFINQNSSGDTIYSPIKSTSATVQIVADNYLTDLFSTEPTETSIRLLDASNNILWKGYTLPNVFSAPYDFEVETFEIDCYDGLSILEEYDYTTINGTKEFVTFAELIDHILSTTNACNYWYFADNIYLEEDSSLGKTNRNPLNKITISEANFFDEDEEPMNCKEVLEEVCKYLGVSATFYKSDVVFLDYDAIKAGSSSGTTYYKYLLGNPNSFQTGASLNKYYSIDVNSFAGNGASYDILGTYNKVVVKDSLYSLDSIIPSLYENEDLKNIIGYPWTKTVDGSVIDDLGKNWTDGCEGYTSSSYIGGKTSGKNAVWKSAYNYFNFRSRYYLNDKFTHYFYDSSGNIKTPQFTSITPVSKTGIGTGARYNYPTMMDNTCCALFAKIDAWTISGGDASKVFKNNFFGKKTSGQYNFTNYLCLILNDWGLDKKLIEVNSTKYKKPFFISNKAKILCTGTMQPDDRGSVPIPLTNYEEAKDDFKFYNLYIKSQLKCGNYYFNGNNQWQTTSTTFTLPFFDNEASTWKPDGDHFNGQEFEIKDNTTIKDAASEPGYIINLPESNNEEIAIANVPEFSFWSRGRIDNDYRLDRIWIKDFDIKYYMPQQGQIDENDTDTEYTYELDIDSKSTLSDIEFKICTWDGKQCNYSAVAYPYNNNYKFVDKMKNDALYDKLINASENGYQRSEQLLAFKIANQYKSPTTKLTLVLKNLNNNATIGNKLRLAPFSLIEYDNKYWIVDGIEYDIVYDRATVNLIEKK